MATRKGPRFSVVHLDGFLRGVLPPSPLQSIKVPSDRVLRKILKEPDLKVVEKFLDDHYPVNKIGRVPCLTQLGMGH